MYAEVREETLKLIELSNFKEAFSSLKVILNYPGQVGDPKVWKDAFSLFEEIALGLGETELAKLAIDVVEDPFDNNALYNFAYELYEHHLHGVAATVLARANNSQPNSEKIISELISNLEELSLHEEAVAILSSAEELLETSNLCYYLFAFNNLMQGRLDGINKVVARLQGDPDQNIQYMSNFLDSALERGLILKKVRPLDDYDLGGWHMVLNGSFLLHYSSWGIESMKGRYAFVYDSFGICRLGIERVKDLLLKADIDVPCIFHLPSRSSKILALAASIILNKPLYEWNDENYSDPGLIVVYRYEEINTDILYHRLKQHRTNQILWIHASLWIKQLQIAGDIITFLHEQTVAPWGKRIGYNQELSKVEEFAPDNSSEIEIANKIITSTIDETHIDDFDDVISMVDILKAMKSEARPGLFRDDGIRLLQRLGSPVKSNRLL